ncbi:4-coumarate--CoA ligase-like 7 [Selaginella moellendorffii]|uniref:4-coumarate--CoA ligase-like 7 n=1 Tax=Selaginella moellendorffii TaxID=88036 RepID=UPI000D1CD7D9|nr:4-coumarate--CoA ligase-like 7 [Selaginella moellendorffii]|eukprot:XP_024526977.1 4-coumarate--CoA ligase-like 7 [Selaginella moellendorffii]
MVSLGICPGDVVLIVLGNSIEFVVLFLGVLALGATVTTANPQNTVKDIQRQVADSRARFVFSSGSLASKIQELRLPMLLVGKPGFPVSHVSYEDLLDDGNSSAMDLPAKKKLSPAALLYSSGTTGVSKGVILSHGNLVAAMETLYTARKEPVPEDEVSLGMLPFFHIAGLIYGVLATIYSGTTMVVVAKFELLEIFETIERYKVTQMTAVPPMIIAFIKHHSSSKRYDLSSLSRVVCGAAPLGRETHEAFLRLYPQVARFPQAYGMTETTGLGFGASKDTVVGSAGKIMPGFEAKVVEVGTGRTLPPGSQGYLNNPKATSETIDKDGWLHTGDLVLLDTDGNMFAMDRLKELIKYKGFQVFPLDDALFPNEEAGEVPLAYVVRVPHSTLSEAEVVDFVSKQVWARNQNAFLRLLRTGRSLQESQTSAIPGRHTKVCHGKALEKRTRRSFSLQALKVFAWCTSERLENVPRDALELTIHVNAMCLLESHCSELCFVRKILAVPALLCVPSIDRSN